MFVEENFKPNTQLIRELEFERRSDVSHREEHGGCLPVTASQA